MSEADRKKIASAASEILGNICKDPNEEDMKRSAEAGLAIIVQIASDINRIADALQVSAGLISYSTVKE